MSRNIPRQLRHKQPSATRRMITHDVSVMVLRTGAVLIWCGCLVLLAIIVTDLVQNARLPLGPRLLQLVALTAACVAAFVVGWRLWALRRWAGIATLIAAWVVSLGEPWRPSHYPGGIVDVS